MQWTATDVSWTDGDTVHVLLDSDATAPDAPGNLAAAAHNKHVKLTWDAPADNGSAIGKYQICVKESGVCADGDWSDIPDSGDGEDNEGSYTVTQDSGGTALANGTAYTFHVRAVNAIGSGAAADETATPVAIVPTLPAGHTALLTATLTVADLGVGFFGCHNLDSGKECSTTTVLSEDSFSYGGTRDVIALEVSSLTSVGLKVSPWFASALRDGAPPRGHAASRQRVAGGVGGGFR